jgi:Mg-chelatase subunit ChlD
MTRTFSKTLATNVVTLFITTLLIIFGTLFISEQVSAQTEQSESPQEQNLLLVSDASGSMTDLLGGVPRIDALKAATTALLSDVDPNILIGLRPFAQVKRDTEAAACIETTLAQDFTKERSIINSQTQLLQAVGSYTPLAYTLQFAEGDFTVGNDNILVLLSDGKDTCGGDPATVAGQLFNSAKKIKIYVIGLGVDADTRAQLSLIAKNGGGIYYDAKDTDSLTQSFAAIVEKEKPVEILAGLDVISGAPIVGDGSFSDAEKGVNPDAKKLTPNYEFRIEHHLKPGQKYYFKTGQVCAAIPASGDFGEDQNKIAFEFEIKMYGDRYGVTYDESSDEFKESNTHNLKIEIFDEETFSVGKIEITGANKLKEKYAVEIEQETNCGKYFIVIGSDDYSTSKYDTFTLKEYRYGELPPASSVQNTTNSSNSAKNISDNDSSGVNKKTDNEDNEDDFVPIKVKDDNQIISGVDNALLMIIGGGVLILLLILIIVILLTRGKTNVNIDQNSQDSNF